MWSIRSSPFASSLRRRFDTNTSMVFVSNLRRKLEADGEERVLHTVRGSGYVLRPA